jgi:hypothetical protein
MKEHIETIDNMDISDSEKVQMHKNVVQNKRDYLNNVGNLIKNKINEDLDPYVEHTHQGLNLRFTPSNQQTVKEIKAIAKYHGLNLVSENKTNVNSKITWLRFTVE